MLPIKTTKNQKPIQSLAHSSGCPNNGVHRRDLQLITPLKQRTRVPILACRIRMVLIGYTVRSRWGTYHWLNEVF
jgi:hypothetical protein